MRKRSPVPYIRRIFGLVYWGSVVIDQSSSFGIGFTTLNAGKPR